MNLSRLLPTNHSTIGSKNADQKARMVAVLQGERADEDVEEQGLEVIGRLGDPE